MASCLPDRWSVREVNCDSVVLAGFTESAMHVVAPPGAEIPPEQLPGDDREAERVHALQLHWRHVVWLLDETGEAPAITGDRPDEMRAISTADAVSILPESEHEFVREAMARQLRYAAAFGAAPRGACLSDEHAQLAGRTRAWVTAELAMAFPGERWYRDPVVEIYIPATADELLQRLPRSDWDEEPPTWGLRRLGRWISAYRSDDLDLPRRLGRSARDTRRRVQVMLWAVGLIGRLPFTDSAELWLEARVDRRSGLIEREGLKQPNRVR